MTPLEKKKALRIKTSDSCMSNFGFQYEDAIILILPVPIIEMSASLIRT